MPKSISEEEIIKKSSLIKFNYLFKLPNLKTIFKEHCKKEFALENLLFLEDLSVYNEIKEPELLNEYAYLIFNKYFSKESTHEINTNKGNIELVEKDMYNNQINKFTFQKIKLSIEFILNDTFQRFKLTDLFRNYVKELIVNKKSKCNTILLRLIKNEQLILKKFKHLTIDECMKNKILKEKVIQFLTSFSLDCYNNTHVLNNIELYEYIMVKDYKKIHAFLKFINVNPLTFQLPNRSSTTDIKFYISVLSKVVEKELNEILEYIKKIEHFKVLFINSKNKVHNVVSTENMKFIKKKKKSFLKSIKIQLKKPNKVDYIETIRRGRSIINDINPNDNLIKKYKTFGTFNKKNKQKLKHNIEDERDIDNINDSNNEIIVETIATKNEDDKRNSLDLFNSFD